MSQLNIQILHQNYVLTCPDGKETQLMEAVERVDQQFQKMRDTSKLRSRERVGVLLAVNLAYENLELRKQLQALQEQLAASQNTEVFTLSDADAERLHTLENQSAHDQEQVAQLAARLDLALGMTPDAPTCQPLPSPSSSIDNAASSLECTPTSQEVSESTDAPTEVVINTTLDVEEATELSAKVSESL